MKTTYNLIGSKSAVLYVLLSAAVDSIDMQPATARPGDITAIVDLPDIPIGLFTSEPGFYRPLLRYLLGVANSTERPIFMAEAAQRQALQAHVDAFVPTAQAYESAAARTVSAI